MAESIKNDRAVRDYLLDRLADETERERIEELLFSDQDFCAQVELTEDDIINDYVLGRLSAEDARSFAQTLPGDQERRLKLKVTEGLRARARINDLATVEPKPSLLNSLTQFFRRPAYAGAFAALLIAAIALTLYFTRRSNRDDLAELQSIYRQSRPTETRISGFNYAPLSQLRGAPDPAETNHLRLIENRLIEATEKSPNANTHHALGIFYETQHKHPEAIKEFEAALRFNDNDARIHNDLGSAHFELAKAGPREKKLEELSTALEQFTRATALDGNLLEALFNRSLALQELQLPREARESWTRYLQKDPSSLWAAEARKNLARIQDERTFLKTDEQVLSDFLAAFRQHDDARAQAIHNETKGFLNGATVPLQLCRRYLMAARANDKSTAKESLDALVFLGNFEQAKHHDAFFLSWRTST
jgi:tetratricopeptide (TPR) repeat protein